MWRTKGRRRPTTTAGVKNRGVKWLREHSRAHVRSQSRWFFSTQTPYMYVCLWTESRTRTPTHLLQHTNIHTMSSHHTTSPENIPPEIHVLDCAAGRFWYLRISLSEISQLTSAAALVSPLLTSIKISTLHHRESRQGDASNTKFWLIWWQWSSHDATHIFPAIRTQSGSWKRHIRAGPHTSLLLEFLPI